MNPCTCDMCRHRVTVRELGQCHGYYADGGPCQRDAKPHDLLCDEHADAQSDVVRAICRDMAPR